LQIVRIRATREKDGIADGDAGSSARDVGGFDRERRRLAFVRASLEDDGDGDEPDRCDERRKVRKTDHGFPFLSAPRSGPGSAPYR
jgi:hypothetical protein